ncbi:ABC transporter ATP-binding protein [Numidum massiliense]|uniref:ABC transporter ATP-binding protein n=1 Tax=Numidum massiliense TaxID=1522315 RepID=UPI0006D55A2E|nr:ABC transporter ATP-binding protein [Numidum massiliense]
MNPLIEVKGLTKSYKKRKSRELIRAVNDVSFNVYRGEILGLLGPNGAGKTSTIKMICGLLTPDAGIVTVNGVDMHKKRLKALRHISAVLEGNRNLYWRLTVRENLEYFAGNRGYGRKQIGDTVERLLEQFRLKEKESELVNRLSRGMQQKLAIAVALLAETDVILLDEPTLGLDVETGYEVRDLLKQVAEQYARTIIISTHDMPVVQELCARTVIINKGQVVVDDRVENLLRLFDARSYTVTLGACLTAAQQEQLQQKFPDHAYAPDAHQATLQVTLTQSEDIYDLLAILKQNNTPVEAIDRGTINFEQVFLKIVKGEQRDALVQSS